MNANFHPALYTFSASGCQIRNFAAQNIETTGRKWFVRLLATVIYCAHSVFGQAEVRTPVVPSEKTVESIEEILALIPGDIPPSQGKPWTDVKKEAANAIFKEKLVETKTRAKLRLVVDTVANWNGLTLFSWMPAKKGEARIGVFNKFDETAKAKLTALNKGDSVIVEGKIGFVHYVDLWGVFTLSIQLEDCTLISGDAAVAQSEGLPKPQTITVQAYVDGPSTLHFTRSGVYWTNGDNAKPGRVDALNEPTYINEKPWIPRWQRPNADGGADRSDTYPINIGTLDFDFELISVGGKKDDKGIEKRTPVEQRPTNGEYLVIIRDPENGARWYKFALKPKTSTATQDGHQPATTKKVFQSVEDILATVPAALTSSNSATMDQSNATLKRDVVDHTGTLRFRVDQIEKYQSQGGNEAGYRIPVPDFKVNVGGTDIHVSVFLYFPADAAGDLAQVSKGSELVTTGVIRRADFTENRGALLHIDLRHCHVDAKHLLPLVTPSIIKEATATRVGAKPNTAVAAAPPGSKRKIMLAPDWNGVFQGGDMTLKDLAMLFNGHGESSSNTDGDPSIMLFEKLPFLTPIQEAKELLKLRGKLSTKFQLACPGMPRGSFSYYSFDGIFEGHFNQLYLVTDAADQVVCVQLVDETPRKRNITAAESGRYHTYNFVNYRTKALNTMIIEHQVSTRRNRMLVVDSALINPPSFEAADSNSNQRSNRTNANRNFNNTQEGKVLEESRWYVPQPIVNLILRCVEKR